MKIHLFSALLQFQVLPNPPTRPPNNSLPYRIPLLFPLLAASSALSGRSAL
jgi:hypothetical protein